MPINLLPFLKGHVRILAMKPFYLLAQSDELLDTIFMFLCAV